MYMMRIVPKKGQTEAPDRTTHLHRLQLISRRHLAPLAFLFALGLLVAACGSEETSSGDPAAGSVVATTGVAADIVSQVAGDDIEVIQLVPDGASPHSYAPSAKEQKELTDADLVVYFSSGLEEALPIDAADASFAIADHVEHGAGSEDPHVWMDPTQIEAALPDLADALAEVDPADSAAFERRAAAYGKQLAGLDAELEALVATIPEQNRKLVTSHDAIGYFADRYGFEFVGAPFGLTPEAEASAGEVADLIATVEAEGVPAVFAQTGDDPEVLRRIAEEAGVEVVDDLHVESLDQDADSYVELLRLTTQKITDALTS